MNKRLINFAAAVLLLLVFSCTDNINLPTRSDDGIVTEITAYADNGYLTKTSIVDNGSGGKDVIWKSGNAISLFFNTGDNGGNKFTTTSTGARATFSGTINAVSGDLSGTGGVAYFWATYPYNATASCDGNSITTSLCDLQSAYANDVSDDLLVTIGRSQNPAVYFRNTYTMIEFTLTQENITKITFSGNNNESVAGEFQASFDGSNNVVSTPTANAVKTVEISPAESSSFTTGTKYYFVFLPGTFTKGYTLKFTRSDGYEATYKRESAFTFAVGTYYTMYNKDSGLEFTPPQNVAFADANFKTYCVENFDTDQDGEISMVEALEVTDISVCTDEILSLQGIAAFSNLVCLKCYGTGQYDYDLKKRTYNGQLSVLDISHNMALKKVYCYGNKLTELNLSLPSLDTLSCYNNPLQTLNLENTPNLKYLSCHDGQLTTLDVSHNEALEILSCYNNSLSSLDVSNNKALVELYCYNNSLSSIIFGNNSNLNYLSCRNNLLTSLDVSSCPVLEALSCGQNPMTSLDVSNTSLTDLSCSGRLERDEPNDTYIPYGVLESLNVSGCVDLKYLTCTGHGANLKAITGLADCVNLEEFNGYYNDFQTLDFSNNHKITRLYLSGNKTLTSLNITQCPDLDWISLWSCTELSSVDFTGNSKLTYLHYTNLLNFDPSTIPSLKDLSIAGPSADEPIVLTGLLNLEKFSSWGFCSLDLSDCANLKQVSLGSTDCTSLDLSGLTNLEEVEVASWGTLETIDISGDDKLTSFTAGGSTNLKKLYVSPSQQIEGVTVNRSSEIIHPNTVILSHYEYTDPLFKSYMLNNFDHNHDGLISREEALSVESINITSNAISSLAGIENCTNLKWLQCVGTDANLGTGGLRSLDVSMNPELKELYVRNNKITSLDLSSCTKLERINAGGNPLTRFSTSGLNSLKSLILQNCKIEELEVTSLSNLLELNFADNNVAGTINLSSVPQLQQLYAWNNQLTSVDLSACPELVELNLGDCPITSIQLACPKLMSLNINNIQMEFPDLPDLSLLPLVDLHLSTVARQMPTGFLRNFPNLYSVNICGYQGASVDMAQNKKLERVWCYDMVNIDYLDLSSAPNLTALYSTGCNNLSIIYLATGTVLTELQKDDHTSISFK